MITEFALDLRHARRKSGLSQAEIAHLVGIDQSTYSRFETGRMTPDTAQLCLLSLIYSRSFTSHYETLARSLKPSLLERLNQLPKTTKPSIRSSNRSHTLEKLRRSITGEHGGV